MKMCLGLASPIDRHEKTPLLEAVGRVAARSIRAPANVPPYERAAMDGYAVRAQDTYGAGKFSPKTLRLIEKLYANSVPKKTVRPKSCSEVATGSLLPKGADAVVMVERTETHADKVLVYEPVHPAEHVAKVGEDLRRGDLAITGGEVLTPSKIGALAALGMATVEVYQRPQVSVLTTGDEVVRPPRKIRRGEVYDINAFTLASVVGENGGVATLFPPVKDTAQAIRGALRKSLRSDLVVFAGGSSVGERDLIMDVLREEGELLFHGIAVKPGKPTVLGKMAGKAVLGMPGYPTSCLSNAYMMLVPMLRQMARLPPRRDRMVTLRLSKRIVSAIGRVEFYTVRVEGILAVPAYKESSAITSMAHSDGYIKIPANVDLLEKDEEVEVTLF